jgi:hypothetical protein
MVWFSTFNYHLIIRHVRTVSNGTHAHAEEPTSGTDFRVFRLLRSAFARASANIFPTASRCFFVAFFHRARAIPCAYLFIANNNKAKTAILQIWLTVHYLYASCSLSTYKQMSYALFSTLERRLHED